MAKRMVMCVAPIGLLLAAAGSLRAQTNVDFTRGAGWLVGYVVNAPHQMLGVGMSTVPATLGGWGVYMDTKLVLDSPQRGVFLKTMTPADAAAAGDAFFQSERVWTTANLAAVRTINRELALYVGGGISWESLYSQYVDETQTRAERGRYWVKDESQTRTRPNVMGGGFFRMGTRVVFQFGAEAAPAGFTVGMHWLAR